MLCFKHRYLPRPRLGAASEAGYEQHRHAMAVCLVEELYPLYVRCALGHFIQCVLLRQLGCSRVAGLSSASVR